MKLSLLKKNIVIGIDIIKESKIGFALSDKRAHLDKQQPKSY